jgi:hypothetical protein
MDGTGTVTSKPLGPLGQVIGWLSILVFIGLIIYILRLLAR